MTVIEKIKEIFSDEKEFPVYNGKNWKPKPHAVIKDLSSRKALADTGYILVDITNNSTIDKLEDIYSSLHHVKPTNGGMFYSLYSQDIDYRKYVHDGVGVALRPLFDQLFTYYKTVINSYIIKHPGPKSEFNLHQDSTGLNEWKYSPLSFWMPLQDTTLENGCMWFIPGSQKWFSPYRGISFDTMFDEQKDLLQPYLIPIEVKKGQALLFDNRIVHLSGENKSNVPRVVVMSGIFPAEASIISCYRDKQNNGPLEIFQQTDDYLLQGMNFYIDCTARPKTGEKIAEIYENKYTLSPEELSKIIRVSEAKRVNLYTNNVTAIKCNIIQEP
ncbi:MAG: phytanoyl-CoA dioxygenase family protein [Bacteroidia bacterium]